MYQHIYDTYVICYNQASFDIFKEMYLSIFQVAYVLYCMTILI